MGFQQSYLENQNCGVGHNILSELLEIIYGSQQIPHSQSSEASISTSIESYEQSGHESHIYGEVHLQKLSTREQCGIAFTTSLDKSNSSKVDNFGKNVKPRIKWTRGLHDRFVECVNRLGGAKKATPKAILNLMRSDTLTVFHVKSHLQKYRVSKHIAEYSKEKSEESRANLDGTLQLDMTNDFSGMQIKEILEQVNRNLHEQQEIQLNLQKLIEEQGKQIKLMLDHQEKANKSIPKP